MKLLKIKNLYWILFILIYIASSDGALKSQEIKIIAEFCLRQNNALKIDPFQLMFKQLARPAKTDFHRFIRDRTCSAEMKLDIIEKAKKIIASNSTPHTEQTRTIKYLEKSWNS